MKRIAVVVAAVAVLMTFALPAGAGSDAKDGTVGDQISDGLMGNEPNLPSGLQTDPPFNTGPQQVDPGVLGPGDVESSGAPGPITCGENWVGPAQIVGLINPSAPGHPDISQPGDGDAPGMNVDCGTGGSPPHSP